MAVILRAARGCPLALFLSVSLSAHADPFLADSPVCVAVQPCDETGALLPAFADPESPCFAIYEHRCAESDGALNKYLNSLITENSALQKENDRLRKAIRRMRLEQRQGR